MLVYQRVTIVTNRETERFTMVVLMVLWFCGCGVIVVVVVLMNGCKHNVCLSLLLLLRIIV